MKKGKHRPIEEIKIGDVLIDEAVVTGIMKMSSRLQDKEMGYARTDARTHPRTQAIFLFNGFGLSFAPLRAGQKKAQNENQKKKTQPA